MDEDPRTPKLVRPVAGTLERLTKLADPWSTGGVTYLLCRDLVTGVYRPAWSVTPEKVHGRWDSLPRRRQRRGSGSGRVMVMLTPGEHQDVRACQPEWLFAAIVKRLILDLVDGTYAPTWLMGEGHDLR